MASIVTISADSQCCKAPGMDSSKAALKTNLPHFQFHSPPSEKNPNSQQQVSQPSPGAEKGQHGTKRPPPWTGWETKPYVYQPPRNPFEHSKSLRHQQPSNPRRNRDVDEGDIDDDSDVDDDENPCEEADREERAYKDLLPKVKQLVTDLGADEKWTLDTQDKRCIVCTFPQRLRGWKALLQHASTFQKRKAARHRAFSRALTEQLKRGFRRVDDKKFQGKAALLENGPENDEFIVWPPVVIVDNVDEKENLGRHVPTIKRSDIQKTIWFSSKIRAAGRMLVVFPPSEVGHLNSKLLVDTLAKLKPPLTPPQNLQGFATHRSSGPWPRNGQQRWQTFRQELPSPRPLPRGFLAKKEDMMMMDPQRKVVKWSVENKREMLKCALKKSKEEHELEKARVKAKLVEVDDMAESHQQFKSRKAIVSQQLRDAEMALKLQKVREEEIARQHAIKLQMMDEKFKQELREMEKESLKQEMKFRELLEANEKQLEIEKIARNEEVDFLKKHLNDVTREIEKEIAQKALQKKLDIERKLGEFDNEIKHREAMFKEEGRKRERILLEKQELEKRKFLEEYNKMRQDFLEEWVIKQAALKEKAERAKQEKEILLKAAQAKEAEQQAAQQDAAECSVCFAEFNEETKRALIQPCAHAKICVDCAHQIFKTNRLCPICRVKMSTKPKALPFKLFM